MPPEKEPRPKAEDVARVTEWITGLLREADAARQSRNGLNANDADPRFSILVSCIGRRLLMGQRTIEETEAVGAELGADTLRLGFYSYGEISPHAKSGLCELHNQTMTVTTLAEVA